MRAMFLKVTSVAKLKNKYIVRSRISEKKFREILWYFSADIEAVKNSRIYWYLRKNNQPCACTLFEKITKNIRILMAKECEKISKFSGEISSSQARLEASLWDRRKLLLLRFARNCEQNGAKGARGKRGRGASGKQPVFGMLKRDGKVYTQIVKNCFANELIPILSEFLKESASTRVN